MYDNLSIAWLRLPAMCARGDAEVLCPEMTYSVCVRSSLYLSVTYTAVVTYHRFT